jgi:hypothetical protein
LFNYYNSTVYDFYKKLHIYIRNLNNYCIILGISIHSCQWRDCGGGQVPPDNFLRDKGIIFPPPDNPTVQTAPFINELLWILFNNIGT